MRVLGKISQNDAFAADTDQSEYFFNEVLRWGDMLLNSGLQLNTRDTDKDVVNPGDAYGRLFNQKDYSSVTEAIFGNSTLLRKVCFMP